MGGAMKGWWIHEEGGAMKGCFMKRGFHEMGVP